MAAERVLGRLADIPPGEGRTFELDGLRIAVFHTRAGDVFAYLRGTARHLAVGRLGARVRSSEVLRRWTEWAWENDPGDTAADPEQSRQIDALRRCLQGLQESARRLVALRYDRGLDLKSIAGDLGSSVGAIKVALLRVRAALARCVQTRLHEEGAS